MTTEAPTTIRIDSANYIISAFVNAITGQGGADDANSALLPALNAGGLWPEQLAALDARTLAGVIVRVPSLWLGKAGVVLDVDGADPAPMLAALAALDAHAHLCRGLTMARRMGAAGVLMLPNVPQALDRPFDPIAARGLRALVPYSSQHMRCLETDKRLGSPRRGEPLWYQIDERASNADTSSYWSGRIHWTHVLEIYGRRVDEPELLANHWTEWPAISVIETGYDALRDYYSNRQSASDMGRRASMFIVTFPNYVEEKTLDAANFEAALVTLTANMGSGKTFYGPPGATVETASLNLSGQEGMAKDQRISLAAAYALEQEVLFTSEVGGLQEGSGSWNRHATTMGGIFKESFAKLYRRLFAVLAPVVYPGLAVTLTEAKPGPFRAPTPQEEADALGREIGNIKAAQEAGMAARGGHRLVGGKVEEVDLVVPVEGAEEPAADEAPSPDNAAAYAAQLTERGAEACVYHPKFTGRCRICGVERVRALGPDGLPVVAWRAIGATG